METVWPHFRGYGVKVWIYTHIRKADFLCVVFLGVCSLGLILHEESCTHVTLYLRALKYFLHFKFQEFLMLSAFANFGDGTFPKWHLTFSHSISINFSPDSLGVSRMTENSTLRLLHQLTNCGKYGGLRNWLWMQGNCLVFGDAEKHPYLSLALDSDLWQSCPLSPVGIATTSEMEHLFLGQTTRGTAYSKPAEASSRSTITFLVLSSTQRAYLESA